MNNLFNLENYDGSAQSPAIDLTEEIDDDWEEIPQGDFHDDHDFSENFSLGEQDWETGHDFDAEAVVEQSNFDSAMTSDTVETKEWNNMVAGAFGQFSTTCEELKYPWETGVLGEIFGTSTSPSLPSACGMAVEGVTYSSSPDLVETGAIIEFEAPADACYVKAIQNVKDLEYFENKKYQLNLACSQWLEILALDWQASDVGSKLSHDMQSDPTGEAALTTLQSAFGLKSPATLLKRASALRRFFKWHAEWHEQYGAGVYIPLPIQESHVWIYFQHLRQLNVLAGKGFTAHCSFLEALRFAKFTLGFFATESVLESKRLQGFAAIERRRKGPSQQAPPLELGHLLRLHDVLENSSCQIDRLGAGVMLVCIYARARWSDLRYIHHVDIEMKRNGCMVLFTREHKTSSVGERREKYLPLIVPWHGVTKDDWLCTFLQLYKACGLDIEKTPLGPPLPAPRIGAGFFSRPLSTEEASRWLRLLLAGTSNSDTCRSHSMKATLLNWCARAGMDKECRAILGHHCSALHGSDVVYSRELQVRAIRKLQMLLHRIRVGLGIDDEFGPQEDYHRLAAGMTPKPCGVPATPRAQPESSEQPEFSKSHELELTIEEKAVDEMLAIHDFSEVKEEQDLINSCEGQAEQISLFGAKLAGLGLIEIDSSSGSDSSDDSSTDTDGEEAAVRLRASGYKETVPDGFEFWKHRKSSIVHKVRSGSSTAACKVNLGQNFTKLPMEITFKFPKCLRCFPSDPDRIRSVHDLTAAIDGAVKRRRG